MADSTVTMAQAPSDSAVRQQALDITQSFAVSAPAGSGKTGLLTQRVLALLASCEQPENLLAITFTRKAAGEMKSRIMAALTHAKNHDTPPSDSYEQQTWALARAVVARDAAQQWQLFTLPNRLRITTIDGLCRQLSQQMPLESGLGAIPDMLDNPAIAYEIATRETLAQLESLSPLQADLSRLVRHMNNRLDTLERLFIQLLAKRDQWMGLLYATKDKRELLEAILEDIVNDHLQQTHHQLTPLGSDLALLLDYAATNLTASNSASIITVCAGMTALPEPCHSNRQQWCAIAECLLTKSGQWRKDKGITKAIGFVAASDKSLDKPAKAIATARKQALIDLLGRCRDIPELDNKLHQIRTLPSVSYSEQQWETLDSLTTILVMLSAQLQLAFQQLGKADYIEVTQAALKALGEADNPSELALKLDYRIQHILIDEFQDTSSPQLELLTKLSAGWQTGDGRTLFLVGDAMQSCYSFRDANVGIFLHARQHGIGDIPLTALDLAVNFRSQGAIVDWVNRVFSDVFPKADNSHQGAVKYRQAIAFKPTIKHTQPSSEAKNNPVNIWLFAGEQKPTKRHHEADKVAALIRTTWADNPNADIAILVRSRTHIRDIVSTLQQEGIPYKANDIDALASRMPIVDLLSLTRALLYPHDRIAWLSLLRAPWCGLDMQDLFYFSAIDADDDSQHTHWPLLIERIINEYTHQLSAQGSEQLMRFSGHITQAFSQRKRKSLRDWVEGLWLALGGPALLLKSSDRDNVLRYFELLEHHDSGGHIDQWSHFQQAVNQLYAKPTTQAENAVQIMTIHKSKGLEFDTVIIPGLDKRSKSNDSELLLWLERLAAATDSPADRYHYHQLLISPISPSGASKDSIYQFIQQQIDEKLRLEADRLLYVGCTRAIRQLHLLAYGTIDTHSPLQSTTSPSMPSTMLEYQAIKPPEKSALLSSLWPSVQDSATIITIENDNSKASDEPVNLMHPNVIVRQKSPWQAPPLPANPLLARYRHMQSLTALTNSDENSSQSDNIARPDELQQRYSRYMGTVIHQALQSITETGIEHWNKTRLLQQKAYWKIQLQQQGLGLSLQDSALAKVAKAINNTINDTTGRWLLDNTHTQSQCEFSLWQSSAEHQFEYIIDRTFITRDNGTTTRWIIDYKSSEPNSGQTLEHFIETETALYSPQLNQYRTLFTHENTPIKLALYFPLLPLFVEL